MIHIKRSPTADTRSCDFEDVSKEVLASSSKMHIMDVSQGINFLVEQLTDRINLHDEDKLTDIDSFHRGFIGGFKNTEWLDRHRKISRHHLLQSDGVPEDVNLVDVLEMIVDCVMAGMARTGNVYDIEVPPDVLQLAVKNTADMLKKNIVVD